MSTDPAVSAPPSSTHVSTSIVAVTVYPSQARIVRRGSATLVSTGEQSVVITGLPEQIDTDSVRVAAHGPAGLRITGVDVAYGAAREDGRVLQLSAAVESFEDEWRRLDDQEEVVVEEIDQIARMRRANAKRVAGADALADVEAVAATLSERSEAARSRRREIGGEKRVTTRRLDAARIALEAAQNEDGERATQQVMVGLEATDVGEVELTVTYVVWGASWHPLYDVRLVAQQVTLGYLGSVQQTSGEDWPAVPLTLSTARPGSAGTLPDPEPWYVDVRRPTPAQRAMVMPAAAPAPGGGSFGWQAQASKRVEASTDEAVIDESGAARVFHAARPVAITVGSAHRVPITSLDLPADVDHVCAPRSGSDVHVRASVTNASAVTLLPGTAAVFRDDEFVGRARLELIAPGEQIELHLGVEDRIDVERELVRRDAKKAGLIGGAGRTVLAYQTTITSYLTEPTRLVLIDQVPVAKDPVITVKINSVRPTPTRTDQLGRYEWDLNLTPNTEVAIMIEIAVESPRDKPLDGLGL